MEITDIKNTKKALRKFIRDKQKSLTREYIEYADEQICRNIFSMDEYKNAKAVFCFVGTKEEIQTTKILQQILSDNKKLMVPKCSKKGTNEMDVYEITDLNQLEVGAYDILEPIDNMRLVNPKEIQLAVIPCMSCDNKGHRLGHGGGYYDRYLDKATNLAEDICFPRVVVCREQLMVENIPHEITDQKMDFVVTEKGIIKI